MRAAAGADARRRRLVRIGLEPGDQFLGVLGRQAIRLPTIISEDDREPDDRLEIVHRIPRHRIDRAGEPTWLDQLPTLMV